MDPLVKRVEELLREERMLAPGRRVVVAVSGGADSVALLYLLHELSASWGFRLTVAHLDHGLRGGESAADADFVALFAGRLGLSAVIQKCAVEPGPGLEARAREIRYRFLLQTAAEQGARDIAVGHHADDVAETVLLNLIRGAGSAGLAGISPLREVENAAGRFRILRPLIRERREELISYLRRKGQTWREDFMNQDLSFLRNRLRHHLLPLLESYNPAIRETLVRLAEISRRDAEFLQTQARQWLTGQEPGAHPLLNLRDLRSVPLALRMAVYREAIRLCRGSLSRISLAHLTAVERLAASSSAHGRLDLPGLTVRKDYHLLRLETKTPDAAHKTFTYQAPALLHGPLLLPLPGRLEFRGPLDLIYTIHMETPPAEDQAENGTSGLLDRRLLQGALELRTRRPGERYQPAGMPGHRKIKKIMSELHIPLACRDNWPVVADQEGVVWLPGFRPAERVKIRGTGEPLLLRITPRLPLPAAKSGE